MFRRVVRFDFLSLVPSTRFSTEIHRAIVVVTKLIQSITLHSKYSWLKEVTLERYSSVTLEEILWMSNLKELKMMINRWQTIDWARASGPVNRLSSQRRSKWGMPSATVTKLKDHVAHIESLAEWLSVCEWSRKVELRTIAQHRAEEHNWAQIAEHFAHSCPW